MSGHALILAWRLPHIAHPATTNHPLDLCRLTQQLPHWPWSLTPKSVRASVCETCAGHQPHRWVWTAGRVTPGPAAARGFNHHHRRRRHRPTCRRGSPVKTLGQLVLAERGLEGAQRRRPHLQQQQQQRVIVCVSSRVLSASTESARCWQPPHFCGVHTLSVLRPRSRRHLLGSNTRSISSRGPAFDVHNRPATCRWCEPSAPCFQSQPASQSLNTHRVRTHTHSQQSDSA